MIGTVGDCSEIVSAVVAFVKHQSDLSTYGVSDVVKARHQGIDEAAKSGRIRLIARVGMV